MLKITASAARQWARIGPRGVYGQALLDTATEYEDVVALSADLANSSGLDRFRQQIPERYLNVGIAEQNLVGVAAGVAKEGFIPFASSFAPFITMRAAEQVRMNLGYMQLNVEIVGIGSGLSMGFLGNSHFGIEDVAIMRSIPGLTIVSPCDCGELIKAVNAAALLSGPVYLRLTGAPGCSVVNHEEYPFEIGKSIDLRHGRDVAIISSGSMVANSLQAATQLEDNGLSVGVYNFHTLKPLDIEKVKSISSSYPLIICIEEHNVIGGLGSAIAETVCNLATRPRIVVLGIPDQFVDTGSYQYMLAQVGLDVAGICRSILNCV